MLRGLVLAALVRETERKDAYGEAAPGPQSLDTLSRGLLRVERIEREARREERESREVEQAETAAAEPTLWERRERAHRMLRQVVMDVYGHDMDASDAARSAQAWVEGTVLPATVREEYFVAYGTLPPKCLATLVEQRRLGLSGPSAISQFVGARPGHPPPKLRGHIPELPEWGLGPLPEAAAAYGAEAVPVLPGSSITARAAAVETAGLYPGIPAFRGARPGGAVPKRRRSR